MSDYLSEEDDEQIEADYERADDRSIKDLSVSSNAALSYVDGWKSAAPSTQPTFAFSANTGPTVQFAKEKDAFSRIVSDEVVKM